MEEHDSALMKALPERIAQEAVEIQQKHKTESTIEKWHRLLNVVRLAVGLIQVPALSILLSITSCKSHMSGKCIQIYWRKSSCTCAILDLTKWLQYNHLIYLECHSPFTLPHGKYVYLLKCVKRSVLILHKFPHPGELPHTYEHDYLFYTWNTLTLPL
jgi:hypothetical protein